LERLESRQLLSASPSANLGFGSGGALAVTIDSLFSNDTTPALSGTIDDASATILVSVDGQTDLAAINNADGTWTLPDGALLPLAEGVYDVQVTATNSDSETATDSTTNELTIDQTAPAITVDSLSTSSPTPTLSGTVNEPSASVFVDVGDQTGLPANNNGNGTWTLSGAIIPPLAEGTYNVVARAIDLAGNTGVDATTDELQIDTIPSVTIDVLASADSTPAISGAVDDPTASITVDVGNQLGLTATNNGDGTWTLPDNTLAPLDDGVYNVTVTATDATFNAGLDTTVDELTIDTDGAVFVTNATPIAIPADGSDGIANPYASTIHVSGIVGGLTDVNATLNQFTHTFPADVRVVLVGPTGQSVVLLAGTGAGVGVSDLDLVFDDSAAANLTSNTALASGTYRPTNLISGVMFPAPAPVGPYGGAFTGFNDTSPNGEWSLYVHDAGNLDVGDIAGGWSLSFSTIVDTVAPVVTVDSLVTGDTTPALSGTVDDPIATILVDVGGQTGLSAINHGDGTWTLPGDTLSALSFGVYNVVATAIDGSSNAGVDATSGELTVLETSITTFANGGTIAIPATGAPAAADPYPANIDVAGLSGEVIDVDVALTGFAHSYPSDLDMLLVGPGGESVVLMSSVGSSFPVSDLNFTIDDSAGGSFPTETELVSGRFAPTDARPASSFESPAPVGPYGSALSLFNGVDPNGTWSLYVVDSATGDEGEITSGWSLTIETTGTANLLFGDADNDGFVKGSDLLAVIENFGSVGLADGLLLGDADDNGAVTGGDLLSVISHFGDSLPGNLFASAMLDSSTASSMIAESRLAKPSENFGSVYLSPVAQPETRPPALLSESVLAATTDAALLLLENGESRETLNASPSKPADPPSLSYPKQAAVDSALELRWIKLTD